MAKPKTETEDESDSTDFEQLIHASLKLLKSEGRRGKPYADMIRQKIRAILEDEGEDESKVKGAQVPSANVALFQGRSELRERFDSAFNGEFMPDLKRRFAKVVEV
jgi:ElaB/YqjD/DUF883 family membrane-anchored ribosome-binding protein